MTIHTDTQLDDYEDDSRFTPVRVGVATVSDTRTFENDESGRLAAEYLTDGGHQVVRREIVVDDVDRIRGLFQRWIDDPEVDVIISTGGTGVTRRDVTPEALAPLVSKRIPGFGELFRWLSFQDIGTATIQSRAEAAICGSTPVFLLPGSPRAVRHAFETIILAQLDARTRPCNIVQLLPRVRG
jgi:molybdopterin adenylyltransferase